MSPQTSSNLDFLRSIAVLLVLMQHLSLRLNVHRILWVPTESLGLFGVLLFFVHTSLVLMWSMERSGRSGSLLFRDFYIRRIFRIYPLSIVAIIVAVALRLESNVNGVPGLSYGLIPTKWALACQLLLVQNIVHVKSIVNVLWSLPFEVQMYVFLPLLFILARRRRVFWSLLGLWGVSAVAASLQPSVRSLDRFSLLRFVPCFLPGIIAFSLSARHRLRSFLWPVFIGGLIAAFTLKPELSTGWVLCLLLGLCIPFFGEIKTSWLRTISSQIATYSYGIYISHQFSIWFALGVLAAYPRWIRLGVLIMFLVSLPIALYHGLERPMIRVGIRVARASRRQPGRTQEEPVAAL